MRIALLCNYDHRYDAIAALTVPNFAAYCQRHGYGLIIEGLERPEGRHVFWAKWHALRQHWSEYDAFLCVDADVKITNPALKIERLLYREITIGSDKNGINAGVAAVQKTPWSASFLERFWTIGAGYLGWMNEDQAALAHLLICEPQEHWRIAPEREMNASAEQWQPGDWLIHPAGGTMQEKMTILAAV